MSYVKFAGAANKLGKMINKTNLMTNRRKKFARRFPRLNRYSNLVKSIPYLNTSVRLLKGIVNAENHMFTNSIGVGPTTAGSVVLQTGIAAGNDNDNRQGNSILAKYLIMRYRITLDSGGTNANVRVILFADNSSQNTTPTVAQVLQAASDVAPINNDNSDRFVIIYDCMHPLSINGDREIAQYVYRKLGFHIKFQGTAGTDFDKNSIFLLTISDQGALPPSLIGYFRLGFYDN